MTLTRLLEINSKLVKIEEWPSIAVAERIWRGFGCPTGVRELTDLLERVLSECAQCGIRYAPIFLQRKKALDRGTWTPQVAVAFVVSKESGANNGTCSLCGGTGYALLNGGRSANLCSCGAWNKKPPKTN
jgi:hypothetical protein